MSLFMKAGYKIYTPENLVVYSVSGVPSFQGLKALFIEMSDDPEFVPGLLGLADYRDAKVSAMAGEVKQLGKFLPEELSDNCSVWVTLVSNPMLTALSMLFGKVVAARIGVQVCSTEERASLLIGRDICPFLEDLKRSTERMHEY